MVSWVLSVMREMGVKGWAENDSTHVVFAKPALVLRIALCTI